MRPEERRQEIVLAAAKVFSQKGYHAASIADIIEAAGVARGTFYRYFDHKLRIFECILEDFVAALRQELHRIEITGAAESPFRQLHQQVARVLRRLYDNPHLTHVMLDQAHGADPEIDAKLTAFYTTVRTIIEDSLKSGIEMGFLRPCATGMVAAAMLGALKELIGDMAHSRPRQKVDLLIDTLLDLFLRGLATDPALVTDWLLAET